VSKARDNRIRRARRRKREERWYAARVEATIAWCESVLVPEMERALATLSTIRRDTAISLAQYEYERAVRAANEEARS
jgi:hypothetical protein